MDLFAEIADERRIAADFVADLTTGQLATPSLCAGWSVRDVAAHLLMPLVTPMPKVMFAMARHRMDFDRANLELTAATVRRSNAQIVAGLRDRAQSRFTPPGLGPQAPLADLLIHGQDMRRPLGRAREIPADRAAAALDFLTSGPRRGYVPRSRYAGLRLVASDTGWSTGQGELVTGPAEAIMLVLAGRRAALGELRGPGVAALAARLA